jgi:nucleotidyltransferase/DNA polymerase involved in DNA repair
MEREILLADMNSFFASVHQTLDPKLQGKPVIVIGDPEQRRGIVLSASYEVKAKGIKTGMALWEARQLCPHGFFIKSQYHHYGQLRPKYAPRQLTVERSARCQDCSIFCIILAFVIDWPL